MTEDQKNYETEVWSDIEQRLLPCWNKEWGASKSLEDIKKRIIIDYLLTDASPYSERGRDRDEFRKDLETNIDQIMDLLPSDMVANIIHLWLFRSIHTRKALRGEEYEDVGFGAEV